MERFVLSRRWETVLERVLHLALALTVAGCGQAEQQDVARNDASPPEESRLITLTLFPFFEIPDDANGFGEPVSIGGVEVCVAFRRAYGGAWKDFVETAGPCELTEANEPLVLHDVPGLAELVITARKDGYRPSVFGVTTWQWDQDVTGGGVSVGNRRLSLRRAEAIAAPVDPAVPVDPDLGDLCAYARGPDSPGCGYLGGARVSLDPAIGNGPFYFAGGRFVSGATHTVAGDIALVSGRAGASFVNLPGGEYTVHLEHPNAFCSVIGTSPVLGYARVGAVVSAPVLPGFSTPSVIAQCTCLDSTGQSTFLSGDCRDCTTIADSGAD